jgi:hypothetical protein
MSRCILQFGNDTKEIKTWCISSLSHSQSSGAVNVTLLGFNEKVLASPAKIDILKVSLLSIYNLALIYLTKFNMWRFRKLRIQDIDDSSKTLDGGVQPDGRRPASVDCSFLYPFLFVPLA